MKGTSFCEGRAAVSEWFACCVVSGVALVVYLLSLDFRSLGDTIYYANLIDSNRYDVLTLHQGYYLVGKLFAVVLGGLFGLSTDQSLAVMSAVFAAGALVVAFRLFQQYLGSARDASIGVLVLAVSYRFFTNATSAEIYIVQSFCLWMAVFLFERRRFWSSGVFIALAMWVTPLTAFYLLWFPALAWIRGFGVNSVFRAGATAGSLYMLFLAVFYEELLWGTRGLLKIDGETQASLVTAVWFFLRYQFKVFTFMTLLYLPAIADLRKHLPMLWVTLAAALPNFYVLSNLPYEDNVFILALDLFFVFWIMVGWSYLRRRSWGWVPVMLIAFQAFLLFYPERMVFRVSNASYGADLRELGRVVSRHESPILFADWSDRAGFVYFNREQPSFPLDSGDWFQMTVDTQKLNEVSPAQFESNDAIYVLEYWWSSSRARFFQSEATLSALHEQESSVRNVERFLGSQCSRVPDVKLPLYRCR